MGKSPNLIGEKFNRLLVLEKTALRRQGAVLWKCKCDCGKEALVTTSDLRLNRVMSCGCYNKEKVSALGYNLIGKRFGRLLVCEKTEKRANNRSVIWKCQCDCGNFTEVSTDLLMKENGTKSCGCLQKEKASELGKSKSLNITNQRFGKLVALYDTGEKANTTRQDQLWMCQCDCGNQKIISKSQLLKGHTNSCGCLGNSKGEYKITQILKNNNIQFEQQKSFKTCYFLDTKYLARFDFYLSEYNCLIEFDGEQHFNPQCFNGINQYSAEENFKKVQEHDKIKNNWCKKNNITLIRIPYTHYDDLCLEDLLPQSSIFIYKGDGDD